MSTVECRIPIGDEDWLPNSAGTLEEEYRRFIDLREQISCEIAACRGRVGENTRRREDRVYALQAEYNGIQQHILEVDAQMRAARSAQAHTTI